MVKEKSLRFDRIFPYFFYGVLSLLILGPLLRPGYILTLDMAFGPHYKIPLSMDSALNAVPRYAVLYVLSSVVPTWILQRFLLLVILFISGISMHLTVPVDFKGARYFAGLLYMVNPFTYVRFQAGHIGLLLAYAVTPWVIDSLIRFLVDPDMRNAVKSGVWLFIVSVFNLHNLFVTLVLCIGIPLQLWSKRRNRKLQLRLLKGGGIILLVFLLLSSYWLVPFLLGRSPVATIDSRQVSDFQSRLDPFYGVFINVAAMYGFWQTQMFNPKDVIPYWIVLFEIIFALAVYGLVVTLKNENLKLSASVLGMIAVISLPLAVGIASPVTKSLYWFLFKYWPFFKGYREPQKFVALLVYTYSFFGALALDDIVTRLRSLKWPVKKSLPVFAAWSVAFFFMTVVAAYTFQMFWGFGGQLKSVDYPRSWYQANELMNKDRTTGKILFLPWHLYMSFGFNHPYKVIVNPAWQFFDRPVIRGDNIELQKVYTTSRDPVSKKVEKILKTGSEGQVVDRRLAALDIRYIVLAKEFDWWSYRWLYEQQGLMQIFDAKELVVFRLK